MLTYTGQRNLYGTLTNDKSSANLTNGDTFINAETRRLVSKLSGGSLENTTTITTGTATAAYYIPNFVGKVRSATIATGSTTWPIKISPNRKHWEQLNETSYESDIPMWLYVLGSQIHFWPTPATKGNTITFDYDKKHIALSVADYTTGNIWTTTNGSAVVVGTATSWTAAMDGRYLQISKSNTVAANGDGDWYEISSVEDTTHLTITRIYQGDTIASGSASYAIGEVSVLPDGFQELPVYRATEIYYSGKDEKRSALFKNMADEMERQLIQDNGNKADSVTVEETEQANETNPNLYITA